MTVEVNMILDSINDAGHRITTFEIYYPRFLTAELNTHRIISRSTASSRAIPVKKRIQMVKNDPFIPEVFSKNKPGMQSIGIIQEQQLAKQIWKTSINDAIVAATKLENLGVHKQLANRVLEPYVHVHTVLTATEWDNFFNLRAHPDADPEFQKLAYQMKTLYDLHKPRKKIHLHLPYVTKRELTVLSIEECFKISTARCARVSYKTFDGKISTLTKDLNLCSMLERMGHLSPFDHPAISDFRAETKKTKDTRQYTGWVPYRVQVEYDNNKE